VKWKRGRRGRKDERKGKGRGREVEMGGRGRKGEVFSHPLIFSYIRPFTDVRIMELDVS